MRYGLLFEQGFLPWDQPEAAGKLSVEASPAGVSLRMDGEVILYMGPSYAESLKIRARMSEIIGEETSFAEILSMGTACAESISGYDLLRVPGGRVLKIFPGPEEAAIWLEAGREAERDWNCGLERLLQGEGS